MKEGLSEYLSEEALNIHREHLRKQCLLYSVFEKMYPEIREKKIREIAKTRINDRAEIEDLYFDILYHKLYFSSFGKKFQTSNAVKKRFRTESLFLYELLQAAKNERGGFILVHCSSGTVDYLISSNKSARRIEPVLAIDLCEHAYFLDYGFNREEYLKNIISSLNLSILDKFL